MSLIKTSSILLLAVLMTILAVLSINVQGERPSDRSCFGIGNNDKRVCGGAGWCLRNDKCICDKGFTGAECTIKKKRSPKKTCFGIKASDKSVCSGNGWCDQKDKCLCKRGYMGPQCQSAFY